jgi:Tfp pilus assembly protein PilF
MPEGAYKGDRAQAEATLRRTLAIQPDRADVLDMLSKLTVQNTRICQNIIP